MATAVGARSGPTSVAIDTVTTRRVRLLITSGYDARNVQVAEIVVDPASETAVVPRTWANVADRFGPASLGATVRFFVRSDGPIAAGAISADRAMLLNEGSRPALATVTDVDQRGREHVASRVLAPAHRVEARLVDDKLRFAVVT